MLIQDRDRDPRTIAERTHHIPRGRLAVLAVLFVVAGLALVAAAAIAYPPF